MALKKFADDRHELPRSTEAKDSSSCWTKRGSAYPKKKPPPNHTGGYEGENQYGD